MIINTCGNYWVIEKQDGSMGSQCYSQIPSTLKVKGHFKQPAATKSSITEFPTVKYKVSKTLRNQ